MPTQEQLDANVYANVPHWLVTTEQGREAATIIMLLALAYLAGRTAWDRFATFLFAFGVWDIWYYVALKVLIDWPASLTTLDLLFLIPRPWYEPVWVPCGISLLMITTALAIFATAAAGAPGR